MYQPSFSRMYHLLHMARLMWQNLNSYWATVCRFTFLLWYCMRQIILNFTNYPFSTFLLHGNIALYPRLWNSGYSLFQILNLFILQLLFQLLAKLPAAVKYLSLHAIIFSTSLETDMRNRGRKMKWINLYCLHQKSWLKVLKNWEEVWSVLLFLSRNKYFEEFRCLLLSFLLPVEFMSVLWFVLVLSSN